MEALKVRQLINENFENVPHLKITGVTLVHWNIVDNNYQEGSRVLYSFVFNKSFGQLLDISPKNVKFLKTLKSEFSYTWVWFTDQNSKSLEVEDQIHIKLFIY